ncbi:MAG: hypothetical protein JXR77_13470, partial [Lentisphaeria bacterium]|nr:hypothetical protein [Lentisphaeria bacterium]
LRTLGDCLRREKLRVARWLILSAAEPCTAPGALAEARRTLARLSRGSVFAVGTAGHFAELNRGRPAADRAGFVAYALAAEVHAHDRRTILENAWAAGWTVDEAALLYPGKRIEVGPVSLRPRQESPRPADPGGGPAAAVAPLPDWADPRQVSLFGACFTLAVVVSLAAAEADTVILFDAVGMEGLMESSAAPPRPEGFPSRAGQVYPLFHVLADLREAGEGVFAPCVVQGHPLLPALQCRSAGQRRILLANPGAEAVQVRLPSACHPRRCRCLDAAALAQATAAPEAFRARDALRPLRSQIIELPPWAYLCIIEEDHA